MRYNFLTNNFEEIINYNNERISISGSDIDLSWKFLKENVESLCKRLEEMNLPKGHPVIIYGHKESFYVVAIIACIRLELPYVPLDTNVPLERIEKIRKITGSEILISTLEIENSNFSVIVYQEGIKIQQSSVFAEKYYYSDDPIVYIIFTSGSTGEPKGVQITRKSIINFLSWIEKDYNLPSKPVFMNQAPFSFDLSVFELMSFLHFGGSLVMVDRNTAEKADMFIERVKAYDCSIWVSTPSFISKMLLSRDFNERELPVLQIFFFCGEILPNKITQNIKNNFSNSRIINAYGPTEATVCTTMIEITQDIINNEPSLPIGMIDKEKKINLINVQNENGKEIGEIEIIGDHVSIGYFNNEKLNKEKFYIKENKRCFKTGDFGFLKGNILYFVGRKDEQIKLNGFRIEVGDINNSMLQIEEIKDAIAVPLCRNMKVTKIVAFIILRNNINEEYKEILNIIKMKLGKKLPEYMIPTDIVIVEKFPYSNNHKIDKKALTEFYMNL
ncbi:MAG: AMP-binding protein [Spirochaetia bacterium]|nr:AMP-binding protein [Spirochaetia bacterium]